MRSVTLLLQEWSGCQAVAIRLHEGGDYPYFETSGFPAAFVQRERTLCAYDLKGQLLRDSEGNAVLECMCGNVLRGRFDAAKPFFTAHGSFWSNNTTALLASTTDADRQARTRNRCNGEGYESVALIPLRTGREVFGLLQLNDRRTDRFTPGKIALFERLADSLALALSERQARESARETHQLLDAVQKLSKLGGWKLDVATGRITWTDEVYRIYGVERDFDPSDVDKAISFYAPEDRPAISRAFEKAVSLGKSYDLEVRFDRSDGKRIWVRTMGNPIMENGKVVSVTGNIMDITERKRMGEALRESKMILEEILNAIPVSVFWKDKDLVYLGCNAAFARDAGFTDPKDVIGKDDYQMGWRDQAELYRSDDRQVIESGSPRILIEEPQTTPEGNAITLLTSKIPLRTPGGEVRGVLGTYVDVTERKQAEDALRKSEKQYRDLVELTHDLVWAVDGEGRITYLSPASLRIYGRAPEEMIGAVHRLLSA